MTITLLADLGARERKVIVDMTGWPQHHCKYLQQQVEEALDEARKAHRNNNRRLRPWLFFIGDQESVKQELFQVSCYPAIYVLACRMPTVPLQNERSETVPVHKAPATFSHSTGNPVAFSDQVSAPYRPSRSTEVVRDESMATATLSEVVLIPAPHHPTNNPLLVAEPCKETTGWRSQLKGILFWLRILLSRDTKAEKPTMT